MGVTVKVELYPDKIRKLQEISQKAFELTVNAVMEDIKMSQTVPFNVGTLEESGFSVIVAEELVARIIFDTPYARRLYWHPEYNFRKNKNMNAGGLWMQTYLDGEKKDFVKEAYGTFLKQLGGGLIT